MLGSYRSIYPGIDLVCYGNDYELEYAFILAPGADASLIRFTFDTPTQPSPTHAGALRITLQGAEVLLQRPTAFLKYPGVNRPVPIRYTIGHGGRISLDPGGAAESQSVGMNDTKFNLVPAGGQPGGPMYDYYVSKQEVTCQQFLRFLNDAESARKTPRGSSMFFDRSGNVWFNPAMVGRRDELFTIERSAILYDSSKSAGRRYALASAPDGNTSTARYPISGVSWVGAVKYCNWLTIETGRGVSDLCYTEGTNLTDWAPVTATNWVKGAFTDSERQAWLTRRGFRLPMLDSDVLAINTNRYNEFFKAASWQLNTNRLYGFGRDNYSGTEANCLGAIGSAAHLMPVGFFDGDTLIGTLRTARNENYYGLDDCTGNVDEWANDFGKPGDPLFRAVCGGSFSQKPVPLNRGRSVSPIFTGAATGFRVSTTYLPVEPLVIHLLFNFYISPETLKESTSTGTPVRLFAHLSLDLPGTGPADTGTPQTTGELRPPGRDPSLPDGLTYRLETTQPTIPPESGPGTRSRPRSRYSLTVQSSGPTSAVVVATNPSDLNSLADGTTPYIRTYYEGTSVLLTAPNKIGIWVFDHWLQNGVFRSSAPSITVHMDRDTTVTAVYVVPPPSVTLTFNPTSIVLGASSSLQATPAGGTEVYVAYEYQYDNHYIWDPGWRASALTTPTNSMAWDHYIRYRVRVQDSQGTWSLWSNEAYLSVFNVPTNYAGPHMSESGSL